MAQTTPAARRRSRSNWLWLALRCVAGVVLISIAAVAVSAVVAGKRKVLAVLERAETVETHFRFQIPAPAIETVANFLRASIAREDQTSADINSDLPRQNGALANLVAVPDAALLDGIGLYRKNGRVENYGANLQERRSGPIAISDNVLMVTHQKAMLIWWPKYTAANAATHLRVRFSTVDGKTAPPQNGTLRVLFRFSDGHNFSFERPFGFYRPRPSPQPLPPIYPPDVADWASASSERVVMAATSSGDLVATLPGSFLSRVRELGPTAILQWGAQIDGAASTEVHFKEIALVTAKEPEDRITLSGKVIGAAQPPGRPVMLLLDDGSVRRTALSAAGAFAFRNIPANRPVSVRYELEGENYFADQGRWFAASASRDDIAIRLDTLYFNPDGRVGGPKMAAMVTVRQPGEVAAFYEPHARQFWAGASETYPQTYESRTFTNNWGYVDRDRFVANPDGCLRLLHLGSSHAVALQVPIGVKYNTLLEEELGVRLHRCVEVLSAGRDNGDIGANYRRICDYGARFKPAIVLLETGVSTVWQLHPKLLRDGTGWDAANNALDNFFYDAKGELEFRNLSSTYPLYSTKPTFPQIVPGVAFKDTLKLGSNDLPPEGREAFKYFGDILKYFRSHHPGIEFVPHTGVDQSQCRSLCGLREATAPNGEKHYVGIPYFLDNVAKTCSDAGFDCINLPFPPPDELLFLYADGHYNLHGHQWLAREIGQRVLPLIKKLLVSQ